MDNESGIQQNVNLSRYYEWMKEIRQTRTLAYLVTGWFDKPDDLRANFTQFNQNGVVLQKYCYGNKDFVMHFTDRQLCAAAEWIFEETSLSNYTTQYKFVTNRINNHNGTYMVTVDITVGKHGTCRDVYFSIETT